MLIGPSHEFFNQHGDAVYTGVISFANSAGRNSFRRFVLSAQHERDPLLHASEEPTTHFELQKLPDELRNIARQIEKLKEES